MTVVLAVVFFLLGAEAQNYALRYNSTTFPGRVITSSGREECPPAEQLEAVRGEVQTNVSALLRTLSFDVSFNVSQYCGSGAWTRIVYINMTNTSQQCPGTFREYSSPDGQFFASDPLFDGQGCGSTGTCCSFNNPPWFSKQLPTPTTDSIEVRVCDQQPTTTDDTPFQSIELYIQ